MALLKNREVVILGRTDGEDVSPTYNVMSKDGQREMCKLVELSLTEDEYKQMQRAHGEDALINVRKIDKKEMQEILDGQNREKVEAKQDKEAKDQDVEVSKIKVSADEVKAKAK